MFLSFTAGVLTFFSPCVLPLIPAFISYIAGVSIENLREAKQPLAQAIKKTLVFTAGFSAVFITLGMSASALGAFAGKNITYFRYAGGIVVIILGLHIAGTFKIGFLNRQFSLKLKNRSGYIGAFLTGFAFAFAWTPCVGAVLASVLMLASSEADAAKGFWLLSAYCTGMGILFVLTAAFINKFLSFFSFVKKYYKQIEIISGILLIFIGVLIMTGNFAFLTSLAR